MTTFVELPAMTVIELVVCEPAMALYLTSSVSVPSSFKVRLENVAMPSTNGARQRPAQSCRPGCRQRNRYGAAAGRVTQASVTWTVSPKVLSRATLEGGSVLIANWLGSS